MTNDQKRDFAQVLYLTESTATQKEIAARVEVSEHTIGKWVKDGGWEKQRRSKMVTRQKALNDAYTQLEELNRSIMARDEGQRIPNNKEADIQVKLASQIRTLEHDLSIAAVMEVGMAFTEHVRNTAPEKTIEVVTLFDNFLKALLSKS